MCRAHQNSENRNGRSIKSGCNAHTQNYFSQNQGSVLAWRGGRDGGQAGVLGRGLWHLQAARRFGPLAPHTQAGVFTAESGRWLAAVTALLSCLIRCPFYGPNR